MSAKPVAVTLILVFAVIGMIFLQPTSALSKPAVPEFTVKYIANSYSVTTTDPYTGQTTTTQHPNNTIQVSIQNQPQPDSTHSIYYNIRVRPHFEGNWTELYPLWKLASAPYDEEIDNFPMSQYLYTVDMPFALQTPVQSAGQFTILTFTLDENGEYARDPLFNLPDNAKVDFQVEAIVGHDAQYWYIQHPLYPTYGGLYQGSIAYDTDSGWSNTETITIGTSEPTMTSTDQPEGTNEPISTGDQTGVMGISWMEVALFAALAVITGLLVVIVWMQKRINQKNGENNYA